MLKLSLPVKLFSTLPLLVSTCYSQGPL